MSKDKLIKLLKDAYDCGYKDGVVKGQRNVDINDFDAVLIMNNDIINEMCNGEVHLIKKCDHGYKSELGDELFCSIKEKI